MRGCASDPRAWALRDVLACASLVAACGGGTVAAPRAVRAYTSSPAGAYRPAPALAATYEAVRAGGRASGRDLVADERLATLARELGERLVRDPQHHMPGARTTDALAWGEGIVEPVAGSIAMQRVPNTEADKLAATVRSATRDYEYNRVGVALVPFEHGTEIVVVSLSRRAVELKGALPRRVEPGEKVTFAGTLAASLASPELEVTRPDGHVESTRLGAGPGFATTIAFAERGAHQVELNATGTLGPTVLVNFPVYVGVEPPDVEAGEGEGDDASIAAAEATSLRLVNEARAAAKLAPVSADASLAAVSRAHSQDMADNHFFAHNSPTMGTPTERAARAGIVYDAYLENIGVGTTAREVHEGLMRSPGHRAVILDPHVTRLGVGAVKAGGSLYITEDFLEIAPALDPATTPASIVAFVNDRRRARGLGPVDRRGALDAMAARAAAEYAAGGVTREQINARLGDRFAHANTGFVKGGVVTQIVRRVDDVGDVEQLFSSKLRGLGVGVARGARPDLPGNALFCVLLFGY